MSTEDPTTRDGIADQSLRAECSRVAAELARLRAEYERVERGLIDARAQQESIRRELQAAQERTREALALLAEARGPIDQFGTTGLNVARHLGDAARRYPRTAKSVKAVLRQGAKLQRSLPNNPGRGFKR
ncbi:MAG: hypothetical protein NVSMB32_17120 [Actinomycetota bacterium]